MHSPTFLIQDEELIHREQINRTVVVERDLNIS
jgi:hypothetical protein